MPEQKKILVGDIKAMDNDGTLASNSDAKISSQKAVKTYVDYNISQLAKALTPKGVILVASDFPTLSLVTEGWLYSIKANVTDNDPTKTNTGQSFVNGDEVFWNGTDWTNIGSSAILERIGNQIRSVNAGDDFSVRDGGLMDSRMSTAIKISDVLNVSLITTNKTIIGAINELNTNKAEKNNVLGLDNITVYTPTTDYHPATKKYVDDQIPGGNLWDRTGTVLSPHNVNDTISMLGNIAAGNLSGSNTGDETVTTIKTKLGAATTTLDGYLTSTDWNTFNGKQTTLWTRTGTTLQPANAGDIVKINSVLFDPTYTVTGSEAIGQMFYDSTEGTINAKLSANMTLNLGRELFFYGKASGDIANGDLCQYAGVQGDHILIKKCVPAEIIANPFLLVGVATESFTNGNYGRTTWFGKINNIYTKTPANHDDADWIAGDELYFDNVTGQLTKKVPVAPQIKIMVGYIIKEQTGSSENGIIEVAPEYGKSLSELSDVLITSVGTGEILVHDTNKWENKTLTEAGIQATLIFGIANTNAVRIDSASVANGEFAKFTANGLESRSVSEVLSDIGGQASLGFTAENIANKSTSVSTDGSSDTKYPSVKAVKDYTDGLVTGLLDYRGAYNASVNTYPATGGSGSTGNVLKGDLWVISVAGTLGGVAVQIGDSLIANEDAPGQTDSKWNVLNGNISYVPENVANKVTSISAGSTDTQYGSAKLLYDQLAGKISNYTSQTAKYFLAAPNAGDGTPSFRAIVASDIPALSYAAPLSGTINEIAYFASASTIGSLAVATYPSLTELSYVKGVTSAIQTQLGGKQATISFGTGVLTALGVAIGSAGAPVLFNGALGTPSSGTVTNLTGTASININGTVGATTATTGKFTTLESTNIQGLKTIAESWVGPSSTAGVYFKGGNVGIGTTSPGAKLSVNGNIEIKGNPGSTRYILTDEDATGTTKLIIQAGAGSDGFGGALNLYANAHATKPGWVTVGLSAVTGAKFTINDQGLAAGTDIFTVLRTGNVGIGTTSPTAKLEVNYDSTHSFQCGVIGTGITNNWYARQTYNGDVWTLQNIKLGANFGDMSLNPAGGNVGIGITSPTAKLHLGASTAAANTGALKLTAGVLAATPEAGLVEYDGTKWYLTI